MVSRRKLYGKVIYRQRDENDNETADLVSRLVSQCDKAEAPVTPLSSPYLLYGRKWMRLCACISRNIAVVDRMDSHRARRDDWYNLDAQVVSVLVPIIKVF
jgi:hypothetical protein